MENAQQYNEKYPASRSPRHCYAELLRHFSAGIVSVEEFEKVSDEILERDCDKKDWSVLWQAFMYAWVQYDDFRTERLRGEWLLTGERRCVMARMLLFLYTDLAYEWPAQWGRWDAFLNIITLGWHRARRMSDLNRLKDMEVKGLDEIWPFASRKEYEVALKHPRLLAG